MNFNKPLFIITSGIDPVTPYFSFLKEKSFIKNRLKIKQTSKSDLLSRLYKTYNTINYIKVFFPQADIILLDSCLTLSKEYTNSFKKYNKLKFVSYNNDQELLDLYCNKQFTFIKNIIKYVGKEGIIDYLKEKTRVNYLDEDVYNHEYKQLEITLSSGYTKALGETYSLKKIFETNNFNNYDCIIKISSNYLFSPNLKLDTLIKKNKITVRKFTLTNKNYRDCFNTIDTNDNAYLTHFYGFDASIINYMKSFYKDMYEDLLECSNNNFVPTTEHGYYSLLDKTKVREVDNLQSIVRDRQNFT